MLNSSLVFSAKYRFKIRYSLYQALLSVCEQNNIVNRVCVDNWPSLASNDVVSLKCISVLLSVYLFTHNVITIGKFFFYQRLSFAYS